MEKGKEKGKKKKREKCARQRKEGGRQVQPFTDFHADGRETLL